MKQYILYLLLSVAALPSQAQVTPTATEPQPLSTQQAPAIRFGYFSYKAVFESMPDHAIARQHVEALRAKYDSEMKRVEDEFNKKYESFLEGQRDFAPSILQKRQAELQDLLEKNVAFKKEAARLLKQAEEEAYKPMKEKLDAAVRKVGSERSLAFICNTDANALPYISQVTGEDVTAAIAEALK